jgi:hypothetical protein
MYLYLDGRTDERMNERTDGQGKINMPPLPPDSLSRGHKKINSTNINKTNNHLLSFKGNSLKPCMRSSSYMFKGNSLKLCMRNSSYMFKGNSLKLCMLAYYYYLEIFILFSNCRDTVKISLVYKFGLNIITATIY